MATILDYSAGYPSPAAIKRAGHSGAIRYLRKRGTSGVRPVTAAERQGFEQHNLDLALVYQAIATTFITGGSTPNITQARANGVADAQWALEQARAVGIPNPRCIYFAADQDIELSREMPAVKAYLSGAASVLGVGRVGIYGEYDVLEQCIPEYARWGWQTAAWSRGQRSAKRHLFQRVGQVTVDGILVDINDVHRPDFGQINLEDDDMPTAKEFLDTPVGTDGDDALTSYRTAPGTMGHYFLGQRQYVRAIREIVGAMATTLTSVAKAVADQAGQDEAVIADVRAAITDLEQRMSQDLDAAVDEITANAVDNPEEYAATLVRALPDAVFQAMLRYAAQSGRVDPVTLQDAASAAQDAQGGRTAPETQEPGQP
jgi:hypothetical protein